MSEINSLGGLFAPNVLLDGKLLSLAIFACCLVNTAIGSTADEADNLVAFMNLLLARIAG